jgi:hypothetical protein
VLADVLLYRAILDGSDDVVFDENTLALTAILLMKGGNDEKAFLLYQECDVGVIGKVREEEFEAVLSKMVNLSVSTFVVAT